MHLLGAMSEKTDSKLALEPPDVRRVMDRVRAFPRPVISLYAVVHPAQNETLSAAVAVRLKNTLRDLEGVPPAAASKIEKYFEQRSRHGRSVAIFATSDDIEVLELDVTLERDGSDHVDARVGEPYYLPLLALIARHTSRLVLFADRDHLHGFRVFLGQATSALSAQREPIAVEQDDIEQSENRLPRGVAAVPAPAARSPQTASNQRNQRQYIADRAGSARQLADENIELSQAAFYRSQVEAIRTLVERDEIDDLIVLGPERDRHLLVSCLADDLARRVRHVGAGINSGVPTSMEVAAHVRTIVEALEAERQGEVLDAIAERGVRGVDECLKALQLGRLRQLVVPRSLDIGAYLDPETNQVQAVNGSESAPATQGAERVDLTISLPEIAEQAGADIQFVSGACERRLVEEFGGMAGLARW